MNLRKNLKNLFLTAFVLALILPTMALAAHDLVIYHTNDIHGYAFEERDSEGRLTRIGYDRLKAIVDSDPSPRKLLLDAGDVLHGQAFATSRKGELSAIVLSLVGYDALATGNHDFDYGYQRLLDLTNKYRLNFLSANVAKEQSGEYILPPYRVCSWSGLKVGIFALATPETRTSTDPRNIEGLLIEDPIESARKMVNKLRDEETDLIIAVTHMGSEPYCNPMSQTIAEKVSGIDIIIDGHSHSEAAIHVSRPDGSTALVASTGSYFQNVGRVTADRKRDGGFEIAAETLSVLSPEIADIPPDITMREAMGALRAELDKEMNLVVMKAPFDLDGARERVRSSSTNLGRIICASLVDAADADAAFLNGGSIRDSIPKGDVTKGQLLSVLPYGNYVFVIEIYGKDLLAALNYGLGQPGAGAFPQIWGMEVATRAAELTGTDGTKKNALAVRSVTIGGKPLDPEKRYKLAINDFLHSGGDGYAMFTEYGYSEFATLEEAFRNFVTEKSEADLRAISDATVLK
jgi:2',3'-cyclic-nucleotide 2'-phosphodiesterase (5'-nucleotidase family)